MSSGKEELTVLLAAYACRPNAGTEPGIGWNWAVHIAEQCSSVHVLTAGRNREAITKWLQENPTPSLHFHFIDVKGMDPMSSGAKHYLRWQWLAFQHAKKISKKNSFDIAHHVSYGSVHIPSFLCLLPIPMIFGPVGGGQTTPESLLAYYGDQAGIERKRTLMTRLLPWLPPYRFAMGRMALVIAANHDTQQLAHRAGAKDVDLMCDTGLRSGFATDAPRRFSESPKIRLLWVGRFLRRKGVGLALDALKRSAERVELTLMGDGISENEMRSMITVRGLEERVWWAGRRSSWNEVREAYLSHDALLFTSLRDSFGSQILEAMGVGLPVIVLDQSGAHDFIPQEAGIKVPIASSPEEMADALASAINCFATLAIADRNAMSFAAWQASKTFDWSKRAGAAISHYRRILHQKPNTHKAAKPNSFQESV